MKKQKFSKSIYNVLDKNILNKLVKKIYKNEYDLSVDIDEYDSIKIFHIKKEKLSHWEKVELKKFINKNEYFYIIEILLQDMCNRNIIPTGKYLVYVR
jgi:hypothetical protein